MTIFGDYFEGRRRSKDDAQREHADAARAHHDAKREHHDERIEHADETRAHDDAEREHADEQKESALLHELVRLEQDQLAVLEEIRDELRPPPPQVVAKFIITQGDSPMPTQAPLTGLAPGATGQFTAAPVASDGSLTTLPAGVLPLWTSDDPTDTVTVGADGLSASVAVATTATAGATHTLSVALPDGSANSPVALPILTPAALPVAGFVVTQA